MADFKRIYSTREAFLKISELGLGRTSINKMLYYTMPKLGACRKEFEHYEFCANTVDNFVTEYKKGVPVGWLSYEEASEKFSISRPTLQKLITKYEVPRRKFNRAQYYLDSKVISEAIAKESKNDK